MSDILRELEQAVRMLVAALPETKPGAKPVLFHSIRVGFSLYERKYNRDICIAGILHDAIEDTDITTDDIERTFGPNVAKLVEANTKNMDIADPDERYRELVQRCASVSEDASIVKAADILDSNAYYTRTENDERVQWTKDVAKALLNAISTKYQDPIFEELRGII